MTLLMAGCSSATAMGYLGKYGNSHAGWMPICGYFDKYCNRITIAVALSYIGFLFYFFLTIISASKSRSSTTQLIKWLNWQHISGFYCFSTEVYYKHVVLYINRIGFVTKRFLCNAILPWCPAILDCVMVSYFTTVFVNLCSRLLYPSFEPTVITFVRQISRIIILRSLSVKINEMGVGWAYMYLGSWG